MLRKTFRAVRLGDGRDGRWAAELRRLWPVARQWLTEEGRTPAGVERARRLFDAHMPELLPLFERLREGLDQPDGGTFLTHAALRPFFAACSQTGRPGLLVRNYDFEPEATEGLIAVSDYLRPVLGMSDAGWGLLDGMNDAGLAVSLTFGGRFVHGPGFAVVLVLRYLLETCASVDQALARLRTLPVSMPQNLTLVDHEQAVTVRVGPDIAPIVAPDACATNHQHLPVSEEQERATRTRERLAAVREAGPDPAAMLKPPLYQTAYADFLGTVYTAEYRPAEGRVVYHWPQETWEQSFAAFTPGERTVRLGLD